MNTELVTSKKIQTNETFIDSITSMARTYADEWARIKAISFMQWASGEGWQSYDSNETWINLEHGSKVVTTQQLYNIYEPNNAKIVGDFTVNENGTIKPK